MQLKVSVAIGIVGVGGWLGTPTAVADDMNCVPREGCNFFSPSAQHRLLAQCGGPSRLRRTRVLRNQFAAAVGSDGRVRFPSFFPCVGDSCMNGLTPDSPTLAYGQTARKARSPACQTPADSPVQSLPAAASPSPDRVSPQSGDPRRCVCESRAVPPGLMELIRLPIVLGLKSEGPQAN